MDVPVCLEEVRQNLVRDAAGMRPARKAKSAKSAQFTTSTAVALVPPVA